MKYLIFTGLLILGGCAVGRGPAGEMVWGMDMGAMAETGEQSLTAILGWALGGTAGGAGAAAGLARIFMSALEHRRKTSDQAREAAEKKTIELAATLRGITVAAQPEVVNGT